jgi:hypothetical protein
VWNATSSWFDQYSYTSFTGVTFTLSGTLSQTYIEDDNAFTPFIDEAATTTSISKTLVYPGADIAGRLRVYKAGTIEPFEVGYTITSTGSTTQAIRTSDA